MIQGSTQVGNGWIPSWESSAVIAQQGFNPIGQQVDVRQPSGRIESFTWTGTSYAPLSCGSTDTLSTDPVTGNFILADKYGNQTRFDAQGMPASYTDRNGNQRTLAYSPLRQLQGITDERGKTYSVQTNLRGYLTQITDPAARTWTLSYDGSDNLISVTTPATPDQPAGITTTYGYDTFNRLTSITDGRGTLLYQYAYVGSTGQVQSVTVNGDTPGTVSFSYFTGRTERTDRNGTLHRIHYSGSNITQEDLWIAGQAKFVHLYRWNGSLLSNEVFPRGNRIDYIFDGMANLLERRHKTTDTSSTDPSDLVHSWTYTNNFKTSYTDPRGSQWLYGRDTKGNLTSITHPEVTNPILQSAEDLFTYNASGQTLTHTDTEGLLTTYVYYASGNSASWLEKVLVGPGGSELQTLLSYDAFGNVTGRTDPRGNLFSQTFDALNRLTETQTPGTTGVRSTFHYDGNGNLTQKEIENRDKDGDLHPTNPWWTSTYTYTKEDQLKTLTEEIEGASTRTTTFEYDENGNQTKVVKPEGNEVRSLYGERSLLVEVIRGEGTPEESRSDLSYDENGNLLTTEDGLNHLTTNTYDLFDRRIKTADPLGYLTEFDYDKAGNVIETRRLDGVLNTILRSTRFFDERGRLWKVSDLRRDPLTSHPDAETTIERRRTGQVAKVTNARGQQTLYAYDTYHRLLSVTDAMGNVTENAYDANGNRTSWSIEEVDGAGTVTHDYEATYDELNRRITQVEIDRLAPTNELTTTLGYDSRGNLTWRVDAEGNPTRFTFDGLSRMVKRERALSFSPTIEDFTAAQVTEWGFDQNSRLISHKDDGPNETTWTYDALGRAKSMVYPDATQVLYAYDDASRLVGLQDPAGSSVAFGYDDRGLETSRVITRGTGVLGTTTETRVYDPLGRLLVAEDDDSRVTMTWAVLGLESLPYEERQEYVSATPLPRTVRKTFDAVGNKATELYPSGLSLAYTWNPVDRLQAISDGTNTIASFTFVGQRKKTTTFQSGATETRTYGGFREEVTRVHHQTSGAQTILDLQYAYNRVHDRLFERFGGAGSAGDAFAYDRLRRLTNAWMGSANPAAPTGGTYVQKIDYNYSDDGNRNSVVVTPFGGAPVSTPYTANNLNQYTLVGAAAKVSDGNGNLKDDGTRLFSYDYRNQLVKVATKSTGQTIATYRYDPLGRRIEKDVSGGAKERYVYSGLETISTETTSGTWKQDFVFGEGIDEIVMLEQADILDHDGDTNTTELTRHFYHRNALGSVMDLSDMQQAVAVSYRYDPYGKPTITRNGQPQALDPLGQHWSFTARFFDEETTLYYYRARTYDPVTGRFLQRDPLGYAAGPLLYQYCESNPFNARDPLGQSPVGAGAVAGAKAGSVLGPAGAVVGAAVGATVATVLAILLAKEVADAIETPCPGGPESRVKEGDCKCIFWYHHMKIDPDGLIHVYTYKLFVYGGRCITQERCQVNCDALAGVYALPSVVPAGAELIHVEAVCIW